jgi:hypothetical protein
LWAWLTFSYLVAGYGIGDRTFRVVWWVFGLTIAGATVLWSSPVARSRGVLWMVGASLHRLLPLIDLYKGFKDFYENPVAKQTGERRNLNRTQVAFFAFLALAGWILASFLLAALGGLTQRG